MVEVRFRRTAKRDLRDIGRYTCEHWSETQTTNYVDQLLDVVDHIGEHPLSGQNPGEVRQGYCRRGAGPHLIFYAVMADGSMEIAPILHEKTEIRPHLDEQE